MKIRVETSETIITLGWPSETWIRYVGVKKNEWSRASAVSSIAVLERNSRERRGTSRNYHFTWISCSRILTRTYRDARPPRIDTRLTFQGLITILPSSIRMNRIHFYPLLVHGRDLPHFLARSSSWKIEPTLARTLAVRRM